jgi:hypothetical protein
MSFEPGLASLGSVFLLAAHGSPLMAPSSVLEGDDQEVSARPRQVEAEASGARLVRRQLHFPGDDNYISPSHRGRATTANP